MEFHEQNPVTSTGICAVGSFRQQTRDCEKAPNAEFAMFMLVTQMKAAWFEGTPVWTVLHISKVCWNIANVAAPLDRTPDYD